MQESVDTELLPLLTPEHTERGVVLVGLSSRRHENKNLSGKEGMMAPTVHSGFLSLL